MAGICELRAPGRVSQNNEVRIARGLRVWIAQNADTLPGLEETTGLIKANLRVTLPNGLPHGIDGRGCLFPGYDLEVPGTRKLAFVFRAESTNVLLTGLLDLATGLSFGIDISDPAN